MAQFTVEIFAEAIYNTVTVLLKATINGSVSGHQSNIALTHDIMSCQNCCDRSSTQNDRRAIQLSELNTSLNVDQSQILLAVLFAILIRDFKTFVNSIHLLTGLCDDCACFCGSLASHDTAGYYTNNAGTDKDFRAVLLKSKSSLIQCSSNLSFIDLFHDLSSPLY